MMLSEINSVRRKKSRTSCVGVALVVLGAFILVGCGGGNSNPGGNQTNPATAALQLNVGDDPCDWVAALVANISSVTLTNTSGGTVSVLAAPTSVEFMHLMGSLQSLSLVNVPQDTYTKATISISSVTVTYLSPATGQLVQQTITGPWNVDVTFVPSLTISSGSMALNLHLNIGHSISVDGNGNITFTPVFTAEMFHGGSGGNHDHRYGGLDHVTGTVTSISANSFVLTMMQSSQSVTVSTDSHTEFEHIGGIGAMVVGMIVMVDADLQADGTLLAREVSLAEHDASGMQAEGLIVSVAGNPATQLALIAHDGAGSGMSHHDMGGTITVNLDSNTAFSIDSSHVDLTGLSFTPLFSASNIFKGQSVEVVSNTGMGHDVEDDHGGMHHGTVSAATEVNLEEQGLRGVVANYSANGSQATFTLNLATDSLFASLTAMTSITVHQQPSTSLWGLSSVANGATVEVHGLLFVDSGNYKLVASRIAAP